MSLDRSLRGLMIADDTATCRDSGEQLEENRDLKYLASTVQGSKVQKKRSGSLWRQREKAELLGVTGHGIK